MADFGGADLETFRAETKAWLEANYPAALKDPKAAVDPEAMWGGRAFAGSADPQIVWMRAHGGQGLDRADLAQGLWRRRPFARTRRGCSTRSCPPATTARPWPRSASGCWGRCCWNTPPRRRSRNTCPRSSRGEIRWCQGYSEPGAGSDLAGLQTKCEDKGDHWLINGQKIWTSYANKADWCFCLVRTDTTKKHEGISFVLIDMTTPGRRDPADQADQRRESPFCETFFTDVKVPKDNLVGKLNGGWEIAKRLLQYERQNISGGFGGGGGAGGAAGRPWRDRQARYVGPGRERRPGRRRPARPHHQEQDGLPGLLPDHRAGWPPNPAPATAPAPPPRSSNTPPPRWLRSARS